MTLSYILQLLVRLYDIRRAFRTFEDSSLDRGSLYTILCMYIRERIKYGQNRLVCVGEDDHADSRFWEEEFDLSKIARISMAIAIHHLYEICS